MSERRVPPVQWCWLAVLAAAFVAFVWSAAATKCETMDEGLFIGGGVAQVERLDPNLELSSPPLSRWVAGVSAKVVGSAVAPADPPFLAEGGYSLVDMDLTPTFNWAVRFFASAEHDHDTVLFWGRAPFALLVVLLGFLLFGLSFGWFGAAPAWLAVAAFWFTPEVLAHAQWAHSDALSSLTIFLVCLALVRALERPSLGGDLLLGAAFALALLVKFTVLFLIPVALVAIVVVPAVPPDRGRLGWTAIRVVRMLAMVWVGVWLGYLPAPRFALPHELAVADVAIAFGMAEGAMLTSALHAVLDWLPVPDSFLKGILYRGITVQRGQASFLLGEASSTGWWYYFPIALALKYPATLLLGALVGLGAFVRRRAIAPIRRFAFTVPPLLLLAAAMSQPIDIGVRNVLFLAPFFALWLAAAMTMAWRHARGVFVVCAALSVFSGLRSWPDLLAWFQPLVGGTAVAHEYLADSNYDWGQDLPALAAELKARKIDKVRLVYFGSASPAAYGIVHGPIEGKAPGWYAISRTYLSGMWPPGDPYAWLRVIEPAALVGGSIALIEVKPGDLSKDPELVGAIVRSADRLFEQREYRRVAEEARRAVAIDPQHARARWLLARGLDLSGQKAAALAAWRDFVALERGVDAESREWANQRIAELGN